MTIFQAVILGIIQGLTELLPISSSAHLFIIPWILKWNIPDAFAVALHVGTLLAICLFFFKDWVKLIIGGFNQVVKKEKSFEGKMFWYLVIATIPGGLIGFVLDKFAEDILKNPVVIASALIIMGIALYVIDKNSKSETKFEEMTFKQTFLIGLSQALAFIPGVSRSGVTMTTGRFLGIERDAVAKYTFLLSTPIVFAAALFKLKEFVFTIPFLIGVFVSFIVGIVVIKFLLEYLKKGSFKLFAIYRIIFGIIILGIYFIR